MGQVLTGGQSTLKARLEHNFQFSATESAARGVCVVLAKAEWAGMPERFSSKAFVSSKPKRWCRLTPPAPLHREVPVFPFSLQQAGCCSDVAHVGGTGRLLCLSSVCGGWGVYDSYRKAWEEALGDLTLIQSQHSLSGSFNEVRCRNSSGDYQEWNIKVG